MRALVIDDNQEKRETVKYYLELAGFEVVACQDLSGGIGALDTGEFDAVFVDDQLTDGGKKSRMGTVTIPTISSKAREALIVAYTAVPKGGGSTYFPILARSGAHEAVHFQDVLRRNTEW